MMFCRSRYMRCFAYSGLKVERYGAQDDGYWWIWEIRLKLRELSE